jgi:NitT/TauT family transport system ATP-binding protein
MDIALAPWTQSRRECVTANQKDHHNMLLEINNLGKTYGQGPNAVQAIGGIDLSIKEHEFVSVVGPSGCGKTTLLKCISGLLEVTTGEVRLRGERISGTPKGMALVFQEYGRSLFPWMSARENILLPLKHKGLEMRVMNGLVEEAVDAVGLSQSVDRYPWQLSGGMQQRIAIARALAYQPEILLMDEPFASVDAQTRADLEDLVLQVRRHYSITILLVTHDIDESIYIGDRVVILSGPPTRVKEECPIDLPEPRDQVKTKELPEFARLRAHVYGQIRRERSSDAKVLASMPAREERCFQA